MENNLKLVYSSKDQHFYYSYDVENKCVVGIRKDNGKKFFTFGCLKAFVEMLREKIKENESLTSNLTGFGFKVINGEVI